MFLLDALRGGSAVPGPGTPKSTELRGYRNAEDVGSYGAGITEALTIVQMIDHGVCAG